jgi:hypothetical protein
MKTNSTGTIILTHILHRFLRKNSGKKGQCSFRENTESELSLKTDSLIAVYLFSEYD